MYFLNIYKPTGLSSFDIIRLLRKKLSIKQIGHSGTLDPLAEGVLQVGVGNATKLLDYLSSDKIYIADFKLGYITETFDSEGEIEFVKKPDVSKDKLVEVLKSFIGPSFQIPPKYSAIKVNGRKLCDLARQNKDIALSPREIEIYSINLLYFNGFDEARIEVSCKKGTYIRSLISDIGKKLGCGAYLTKLVRTRAGNFDIDNANNIEDDILKQINPADVLEIPKINITDDEYDSIMNGKFIKKQTKYNHCKILLIYNKKLVSLAEISDNLIKPKKNFKGE